MSSELSEKYNDLKQIISSLGSLAVAFSGGVDSAFLLHTAKEVLGDRVTAVTVVSGLIPEREAEEAEEYCKGLGIRQIILRHNEMETEGLAQNPENRCYLCKREIFTKIRKFAESEQICEVAEGSNVDDMGDYRPGMQAITELGIRSPLKEAGLTKIEIRELSRKEGLPTWDKPSFACLASRIPYGETITPEKLKMIERAEEFLLSEGFRQMRVRAHRKLARIELLPEDFPRFMKDDMRLKVDSEFKKIGFSYVSLDLRGFRSGSMNETIQKRNSPRAERILV